jgi:hypothetical protein
MGNWLAPEPPPPIGGALVDEATAQAMQIAHRLDTMKGAAGRGRAGGAGRDWFNLIDWNYSAAPPDGRVRLWGPVFLGSALALTDKDFMREIGAVVTIIDPERCPRNLVAEEFRPAGRFGPTAHLYIPLDDAPDEDISRYFETAYRFIRQHQDRNVPVFIHCMAGMSRSATLAAYFLMRKYNMSAMEALVRLKEARPIVRPNDGFIKQLITA